MDVFVKQLQLPPIDVREVLRYARAGSGNTEILALLDDCIREAEPALAARVCYVEAEIAREGDLLDFCGVSVRSAGLAKHLADCHRAVLFAATVGVGIDRLIAKYSRTSPAKALLLQALGAERVESLCDVFCLEIADGRATRSRFSPGYGDLPLSMQTDLFRLLDCPRKIGLSLNDSLLMTPTKSVTAILGVE